MTPPLVVRVKKDECTYKEGPITEQTVPQKFRIAITLPGCCRSITSLTMAPPRTKRALLKNPPKKHATMRNTIEGAASEAISVAKNATFVRMLMTRLPYTSESGAQTSGPMA